MSYLKTKAYQIIPKESYKIIRNCSGCGGKAIYENTCHFRINANGNKLDVWLIYQCRKCKHTYNLSIYERIKPQMIQRDEYEGFLANNPALAKIYGLNKQLMAKNKVEVDWNDLAYELVGESLEGTLGIGSIEIQNPYGLKLRTEKVLSEILQISRNKVKLLEKEGIIAIEQSVLGKITKIDLRNPDNQVFFRL